MLGEVHSLTNDFPEHSSLIEHLLNEDQHFLSKSKAYNDLDKKIRTLELNNIPTTDQYFTELKKHRAKLKDELYNKLIAKASY